MGPGDVVVRSGDGWGGVVFRHGRNTDFRGFNGLELDSSPTVTVLVGVNGAGKSSLLDAIALMLTYMIPARIRTPHEFDAISVYDEALLEQRGGVSSFRGLFREEEEVFNEQQLSSGQTVLGSWAMGTHQPSRLPQVRQAIERLFPRASELRIERRPQRMTLPRDGARLDVAQLSDGAKTPRTEGMAKPLGGHLAQLRASPIQREVSPRTGWVR